MKLFILLFGDWGPQANIWFAWNIFLAVMFGAIIGISFVGIAGCM